ncbi:MAG: hypothetical protein JWP92_2893 [Caulobacter sp.]|nr:hypothetical protein [Caulobacter sp.]
MSKAKRSVLVATLAALWCLVLALALAWNRILSSSVDISYHLQVMEVVRHAWIIPPAGHEFMAEMILYPKLSHRLAALAALLGRGELNALTLMGCLSAAIVWLCLFDQARRVSRGVLASGLALAIANVFVTRASLGGEIVGNFFYPQIVGEAVGLLSLVAGAAVLNRSTRGFVAFAVAATLLCGCFHLVPTLKLAGAFMALLGVAGLRTLIRERRLDWVSLLGLVAIPAAVVLNPFFGRMRWMATNNGSVNFHAELSLHQLGAAGLLLLALSAWVLLADLLRPADPEGARAASRRAALLLAALGAATAASLLAQYAALHFLHDGSVYAVRKHGFGVFSLLALVVPVWVGARGPAWLRGPAGPASAVAAQTALMLCLFLRPSAFDVAAANSLLRDVREVRLTRGLHGDQVLFSAAKAPPVVNYMATIAMLQAPHGGNVLALLTAGRPNRPGDVAHVVTLAGDAYDKPGCRVGPPVGQVVVVSGPCIEPPSLVFKAGGSGVVYLRDGWTPPEAGGVWSNGHRATVDMPVSPGQRGLRGARLEIASFAFLPDQQPFRTVKVSVEGSPPQTFTFNRQDAIRHDFALPLSPDAVSRASIRVVFDIADPATPKSLGLGPDTRALGVGLEAMRIVSGQSSAANTQ